jgi:tetratricopeptide (TPR) repeat protein
MRWTCVLAFLLLLTGVSRAGGPDDQYLDIYNQILQADNMRQNGHTRDAAAKYLEAQKGLILLKQAHPAWNTEVVSFRLDYLSDQLQSMAKAAQAAPAVPATAPAPAAAPVNPAAQIAGLQEQISSLMADKGALENKLKEALSVQPAAVSPVELAKAQEKITALEKEKDLLTVALEQAKAAKPVPTPAPEPDKLAQAEIEQLKNSLADAKKQIATDTIQMEALKQAQASAQSTADIAAERDKLKEELAARTKQLADAEARPDQTVVELRAKLADVERQRDELQAKLAAVPPPVAPQAPPATAPPAAGTVDAQVDQLRARLAVLEAQAVPYTPEELAVLKKEPLPASIQAPTPPAEHKHAVRSKKDLPPGTAAMMDEVTRAAGERDYATAEKILLDILHQDENNVYVLEYLANTQLVLGQLAECEKTVMRALALDPEDPPCLQFLGILRYNQKKLDEALNALSRSAKYLPTTNATTQYYLGRVLEEKGLRSAAEAAFRKTLEVEPNYSDAHFNLAFIYALEKPPSLALARWHYQRALDLGHEKSFDLEKMLAVPQAQR